MHMSERGDFARDLWNEYWKIHQRSPDPGSQEKAIFYTQNSDAIKHSSDNLDPTVAVVIPAHNEEGYLARTLASINAAFGLRTDVCLLVVDNASTDATAEIVQEFGGILVREPKKGIGQARQTGLEAVPSSVKYVLTTDADTVVQPDWISRHQEALSQRYIVFTYGGVKLIPENTTSLSNKINFSLCCITSNSDKEVRNIFNRSTGGSNNGFRKESAIACGGYDRNLTHAEDYHLHRNILSFGYDAPIDSEVITSARRFVGISPLSLFRFILQRKYLSLRNINNSPFVNYYPDYRPK